ncbi:MAG TPA: DinB family protein [Vicinamibacterales bacterium]|nr:DinB family protein [Vicinamibacterales bacterium]
MAMNEIERIVDQLEREHAGEPWHGSSLRAILDGVTHEEAAARPLGAAHTIWELVLHITAWKNEARSRLEGAPAGEPREGDWPPPGAATSERWAEALHDLETAHRLLVSAVRAFPEQNLHVPTNDPRHEGPATTNYELLMGIVQHDVYHSGQIALLRKAAALR